MMIFSVCIDAVFKGMDQAEALGKVAEAGFGEYEFWGWWDKDIDALAARAASLSLSCRALCTRFKSLVDPGEMDAYLEGLEETAAAAKKLGARFIISQTGIDTGSPPAVQHRQAVKGLKTASSLLEGTGLTLLVEPLNRRVDHPGAWLESSDEGLRLIDETGSDHVRLLFDLYHQQISEGDIERRVRAGMDYIGHFHCAGISGRHELEKGELDYRWIFELAESLGYGGAFGLEYFPLEDPLAGLRRVREQYGSAFN
ncbi:MAG: TIM barrel protein [Treponema sp.]|jgi:hydroxypyruvate isomerase|nr:TIM barrel protein [Treponema sp.]